MSEGIPWNDVVFNAPETKAASELAYPTDNKMSDRRFRDQQVRRIAFRAGAAWRAESVTGEATE